MNENNKKDTERKFHAASDGVLAQTIESLSDILEREKRDLEAGQLYTHEAFAREKLQVLASLSRMSNQPEYIVQLQDNRGKLEKLDGVMQDNMSLLQFRMNALNEISQTISEAMQDTESDGTYQVETGRRVYDQW